MISDQENLPSNVTCLCNTIIDSFKDNCKVVVIYTDFEEAIDCDDHKLLSIGNLDFSNPLLSRLNSYLINEYQFIKALGFASKPILVPLRTPQGGHLSRILFLLLINGISSNPQKCHFLFFADDLKIYSRISSIDDCLSYMRN